jgi:chitinase
VVAATDGVVYYSLSTGEEVEGTASWDIAFRRSRLIFTNSGATAAYPDVTSTGSGGVWHVTKTNLAEVTVDDAVKDDPLYGPYNQDVIRYVTGMGGAAPSRINIMTFVGYPNEDENNGLTPESPWNAPYNYDKKQFYNSEGMPPVMSASNQIYIIKHGDGSKYSKILINAYESSTANGTDTYQIIYQNF